MESVHTLLKNREINQEFFIYPWKGTSLFSVNIYNWILQMALIYEIIPHEIWGWELTKSVVVVLAYTFLFTWEPAFKYIFGLTEEPFLLSKETKQYNFLGEKRLWRDINIFNMNMHLDKMKKRTKKEREWNN